MNALHRTDAPARTDVWAASTAHSNVRYQLQAEAEPDSLCRVLNLFALQFLTPHRLQVSQEDDLLHLDIGIAGLSWHRAEVIAQKLRNLVCVGEVSLENVPQMHEVARGLTG